MTPKVYDCFMIHDELDMADLRFHVLDSVVDQFVVVESGLTHSGQSKPTYFGDALDAGRFNAFKSKIIYAYRQTLIGVNAWERERFNRGVIGDVLRAYAQPDDWVIVSDCDEIARPGVVSFLSHQPKIEAAQFEVDLYYYDFQHRVQQGWAFGACRWRVEQDANRIRTCAFQVIPSRFHHSGWHLSYFGDAAAILRKARAFMHHDWIDAYRLDEAKVQAALEAGVDLWGRGDLKIERVAPSRSLPGYVWEQRATYEALGWLERQTEVMR